LSKFFLRHWRRLVEISLVDRARFHEVLANLGGFPQHEPVTARGSP
jgi:hypothetical protein